MNDFPIFGIANFFNPPYPFSLAGAPDTIKPRLQPFEFVTAYFLKKNTGENGYPVSDGLHPPLSG
jgi:hypothetical protein